MHSEEFMDSVDDIIAGDLSGNATRAIEQLDEQALHKYRSKIHTIIYRTIRAALKDGRRAHAAPRIGSMNFTQALDAVVDGKLVTRPHWHVLRALRNTGRGNPHDTQEEFTHRGKIIDFWELDNLDGIPTGGGSPYSPTDEEKAATDWMYYEAPDVELCADLNDLDE